jgi:hypothetical protein
MKKNNHRFAGLKAGLIGFFGWSIQEEIEDALLAKCLCRIQEAARL